MEEPADWSLGLPVELPHVWLWAGDDSIVAEIGELPVLHKPGSSPEIEGHDRRAAQDASSRPLRR